MKHIPENLRQKGWEMAQIIRLSEEGVRERLRQESYEGVETFHSDVEKAGIRLLKYNPVWLDILIRLHRDGQIPQNAGEALGMFLDKLTKGDRSLDNVLSKSSVLMGDAGRIEEEKINLVSEEKERLFQSLILVPSEIDGKPCVQFILPVFQEYYMAYAVNEDFSSADHDREAQAIDRIESHVNRKERWPILVNLMSRASNKTLQKVLSKIVGDGLDDARVLLCVACFASADQGRVSGLRVTLGIDEKFKKFLQRNVKRVSLELRDAIESIERGNCWNDRMFADFFCEFLRDKEESKERQGAIRILSYLSPDTIVSCLKQAYRLWFNQKGEEEKYCNPHSSWFRAFVAVIEAMVMRDGREERRRLTHQTLRDGLEKGWGTESTFTRAWAAYGLCRSAEERGIVDWYQDLGRLFHEGDEATWHEATNILCFVYKTWHDTSDSERRNRKIRYSDWKDFRNPRIVTELINGIRKSTDREYKINLLGCLGEMVQFYPIEDTPPKLYESGQPVAEKMEDFLWGDDIPFMETDSSVRDAMVELYGKVCLPTGFKTLIQKHRVERRDKARIRSLLLERGTRESDLPE